MVPSSPPWLAAPEDELVVERLAQLRARIAAAGRDPAEITVMAVTKGFAPGAVRAALAAGIDVIGENYPVELVAKAAALTEAEGEGDDMEARVKATVCWHFLGAIQRRRIPSLAPLVACWQTLARVVEGEAIARHAPGARVLVEVETTGHPGRNGCAPAEVPALVATLRTLELRVTGLMTIGPGGPAEDARAGFRQTAQLAAALGLPDVSMGMSDDLEVAVAEGATMVRVGRGLFGPRRSSATGK